MLRLALSWTRWRRRRLEKQQRLTRLLQEERLLLQQLRSPLPETLPTPTPEPVPEPQSLPSPPPEPQPFLLTAGTPEMQEQLEMPEPAALEISRLIGLPTQPS